MNNIHSKPKSKLHFNSKHLLHQARQAELSEAKTEIEDILKEFLYSLN